MRKLLSLLLFFVLLALTFGQGAIAQVVRPLATPRAAATARPTITVRYPTPAVLPVTAGLALHVDAGTECDGVVDGTATAQWDDQSGNARHLTQATGSLQPTCQTAAGDLVNGRPVLDFDGAGDYLREATIDLAQSTTIFVVADSDDLSTGNQFFVDGVSSRQAIYWRIGGEQDFYAGSTEIAASAAPTANTMRTIAVDFDGASSAEWLDGTANGTGNPGASALTGITVGNSSGLSGPWNGQYAMLLVYAPKLSTGDRQLVEAYIRTRWGTP